MLTLFLQGLLIGFAIAAPVGPIGILCINRTLQAGALVGVVSGLGAAFADACYGLIAGFGLVAVSEFLLKQALMIRTFGGLFLIYLGCKTYLSSTKPKSNQDKARTLWQDFTSTFFLTLTNPATILSFIAIYTSFGLVEQNANYIEASIIVLGIFLGSLAWWFALSTFVNTIRHKLSDNTIKGINRISGIILVLVGLFALLFQK